MTNAKVWLGLIGVAVWVGCGNSPGGASNGVASGDAGTLGSATDISQHGEMPTNAANSADNGLGGPVQRETGNYQRQNASAHTTDEELAKGIKVALTTGSTGTTGTIAENQLTKIDVKVNNGQVTLSGPVASEAERVSIGKQVADFPGVKSIQNNLTVGGRSVDQKPLEPLVPRTQGNQ